MKRVLVLTAGYGEGHNTAARNLAAALNHLGANASVLDPYAEAYGNVNTLTARGYLAAINHFPRLWQATYWFLDHTEVIQSTTFLMAGARDWLGRRLREESPDIVCSTFPAYNYILDELHDRGQLPPFLRATMVTDSISVNSLWWKGTTDILAVPNQPTADVVAARGVPPEKIAVTGFPVQLDFALPERRAIPPPLGSGPVRLLYIINSGKQHAHSLVRALLAIDNLHLTVAVGRDQALLEKLRALGASHPHFELHGWTDQMPRLLMTHHLVVTKAGGATVQEAIAAGCPLIINQVVPGQEEGNWELIRRLDAGALAHRTPDVLGHLRRAIENNAALLHQWRANILADHRPDAALTLARLLLDRAP